MKNYPEYNLHMENDTFEGQIDVPEDINSRDSGFTDSFEVVHLEESNGYLGNSGNGVVISYKLHYDEELDTLFPKILFLRNLASVLDENISPEHSVETYSGIAVI